MNPGDAMYYDTNSGSMATNSQPFVGNNDFRGYLAYLGQNGDNMANKALNFTGNDGGWDEGKLSQYAAGPGTDDSGNIQGYKDYITNAYRTYGGGSQVLGSATGGSGSTTPSYSQEDLAYLDAQSEKLGRNLGRTDTYLNNSLDALLQNYNKELSGANLTRSRNLEDFDMKTQQSESGRARELGKNDTRARSLANGLRQRIGLASGSGSSAYQITAPRAVQQEASQGRSDILGDYAANFQALDVNKRRSNEDFQSLLSELDKQKLSREGGVRGDIEEQRNSIRENQARVAGQRQQLLGGGYNGVRSAMQPFESQIQQGESLLDSIYSKYAAKYNVNPLQTRTTNLRDYATDKVAVRDNAATGSQNPYSPYKAPFGEEEEQLGVF